MVYSFPVHYNIIIMQPLLSRTLDFVLISLAQLPYRVMILMQYSRGQLCLLCLSGFSSRYTVTKMYIWDDNNKCMTIIDNLCLDYPQITQSTNW